VYILRKVGDDNAGLSQGWGGLFASWILEHAVIVILMKKKKKERMLMGLTKKILKDTNMS